MSIHNVGIPIEVLVQTAYEKVSDSATKDLRSAVDKIEHNNAMKGKLRNMQKKLALFKQKMKSGNKYATKQAFEALKTAASDAGFNYNSDVMKMLNQGALPKTEWTNNGGTWEWHPKVSGLSEDDKTKWDDYFKDLETVLDAALAREA